MSPVNAFWLATRLTMRSGAMTCTIHRHVIHPVRIPRSDWKCTNLSLSKDGQEDICNSGTPLRNNQQRAHSVKRGRFNEHRNDGLVQSADSWGLRGGTDVPAMPEEPDTNNQGEEDIEWD